MFRDGKMKDKTRYVTDEITDGALQFLDGYAGEKKPFYLSIHSTAPHSPWDAPNHPTEYLDMYSSCAFQSTPDVPRHVNSRSTDDSPEKRRENLTGYFAAITAMDRCVGKLVAKLKALGKYENTLFIFTSDNGMNMGHHGIWGKGNGTFPMNMYDTSVRVPMIVSMPGIVPEGVVEKGMFSQYDIMPQDESLPGKSFAAVIDGKHAPHDSGAIGVFDEYGPVRMIRDNQWKYIHRYPYGPHELYHLSLDSGEENNLLDDERIEDDGKAKAAELRGRLESWFAQYVDPERDGSRQGVTGLGQLDLVMAVKQGREPFEK
jgi:arylsulfatase A-like enzyme